MAEAFSLVLGIRGLLGRIAAMDWSGFGEMLVVVVIL